MPTTIDTDRITFNDNSAMGTASSLGLRNRVINGKMDIAQRGTSFAAIASGAYSLDRWVWNAITSGVVTISQQADAPSSNEFQSSLRVAVTTADASIAAGDIAAIVQRIEGYNVRDLIGRTFTLSFWVRSSKTGIHCVSFFNNASATPDRSYILEYAVNAANTWEQKSVTVSGGLITAGTWDWTNGSGLGVRFALAAGATFQTTAGAWQTGPSAATANQVNCLDTIGNIFAITGVQLEAGNVATPFEHRPIGFELGLCQRYFWKSFQQGTAPAQGVGSVAGALLASTSATSTFGASTVFPVVMRISSPTVTTFNPQSGALNANWRDTNNAADRVVNSIVASDSGLSIIGNAGIVNGLNYIHATVSAEL